MRLSHETKFIILARPPEYDNNTLLGASLVAQMVKCLSAMWETWVRSLGWEDPRKRERLPTPVFWPGEFHGLYRSWGLKESDRTEQLSLSLFTFTYFLPNPVIILDTQPM